MDEMVPETITEEQILNLKLYREIEDDELSNLFEENDDSESNMLPGGYELTGNKHIYVIHKFLGHGSFGYAYSAMAKNLMTGEEREVVLKEFYPHEDYHREGNEFKAVANDITNFNIEVEKEKFRKEAEIMRMLGNTNDSHIVPAEELFESEKTGTLYYVMPFYHSGSLEDLQNSGTIFTEEVLLHHVVTPLCKALHVAHKKNVLHLDIKPENILVDDNGDAVLTDFGVAKQYDEEGAIINRRGVHGTSSFAAPEMRSRSAMVKFGSEPDIFALSATLYNLATLQCPHPIQYNSDEDRDLRENMEAENLSAGFINAIIAGLQAAAPARPSNAQAFLKMFPGCEDIEL
jgi:serine/threonine-protein kinase